MVLQITAANGTPGKGGLGGTATYVQNCTKTIYEPTMSQYPSIRDKLECRGFNATLGGKNGKIGKKCPWVKPPKVHLSPSPSVVAYMEYARERATISPNKFNLLKFIADLTEHKAINALNHPSKTNNTCINCFTFILH